MPREAFDEHDKEELELFVENTGELYPDKKRIIALMVHRITSGTYKAEAAAKMWRRWLDKGAIMYRKEIRGEPVNFTSALNNALATELASKYEEMIRRHETW